jgi:hypothetical protein
MAYKEGDRVHRLTLIRRLPNQQFLVQCECGSKPFPCYSCSLRTSRRRACEKCQRIENEMVRQIEAAKKAAEKNGLIFHEPSSRSKWQFEGNEAALVAEQERGGA